MWDLIPWPGIEARLPTLGALSLNHWTTKEAPISGLLFSQQRECLKVFKDTEKCLHYNKRKIGKISLWFSTDEIHTQIGKNTFKVKRQIQLKSMTNTGDPVVRALLSLPRVWVLSLIWELRSCKLFSLAKKKWKDENPGIQQQGLAKQRGFIRMEEYGGHRTTEAAINVDYFPNTVRTRNKTKPSRHSWG